MYLPSTTKLYAINAYLDGDDSDKASDDGVHAGDSDIEEEVDIDPSDDEDIWPKLYNCNDKHKIESRPNKKTRENKTKK